MLDAGAAPRRRGDRVREERGRRATAEQDDLAERVRLVEDNLPNTLAGTAICLVASLVLLHGTLSPWFLWPWFGLQLAVGTVRFLTARALATARRGR